MQEISVDVAKKIKMSREAELNMERCAEFMARMIQKYGKKILDDIAAESSDEQPEQPKRNDKKWLEKNVIGFNMIKRLLNNIQTGYHYECLYSGSI